MAALNTNLKFHKATTQFINYPFNSMCNFNGKQLGAGTSGLNELGGGNDAGAEISAWFEPIMSDWGSANPKRIRFMYFGYECDGPLTVTVSGLEVSPGAYPIPCKTSGEQQRCRVTVSRLAQRRYWTFKLANTLGADFSIDAIDCLFIQKSHGHSSSS